MSDDEKPGKWDWLKNWLSEQGVSTVLLFGVLIGIGYVIIRVGPDVVSRIEASHERIEASQEKQIERVCNSFDANQDRDDRRYNDLLHEKMRGDLDAVEARPIARKRSDVVHAP